MRTLIFMILAAFLSFNKMDIQAAECLPHKNIKQTIGHLAPFKQHHNHKRCHRKKCCKRGPTGPTGATGATGATGGTGATGSVASDFASQALISPQEVSNNGNIPLTTPLITPVGITYDTTANVFNFTQTGYYLVSYGISVASPTSVPLQFSALTGLTADLAISGTPVPNTIIGTSGMQPLVSTSIIIQISDITTQNLSLQNTSGSQVQFGPVDGSSFGAFVTISLLEVTP